MLAPYSPRHCENCESVHITTAPKFANETSNSSSFAAGQEYQTTWPFRLVTCATLPLHHPLQFALVISLEL